MKLELTAEYVREGEYDDPCSLDEVHLQLDGRPVVKLPIIGGNASDDEEAYQAVVRTVGDWFERIDDAVRAVQRMQGGGHG